MACGLPHKHAGRYLYRQYWLETPLLLILTMPQHLYNQSLTLPFPTVARPQLVLCFNWKQLQRLGQAKDDSHVYSSLAAPRADFSIPNV